MAEDARSSSLRRAARRSRVELVDLDVQGYAVVGDDRDRRERRLPNGVSSPSRRPIARLLAGDAERRAGGGDAGRTGGDPEDPAAGAHASIVSRASASTYRRVIRPPIRVTIS